ncbi:MAG: helix-turn-helix transcriptional regulator [Ruminococcus sp.]
MWGRGKMEFQTRNALLYIEKGDVVFVNSDVMHKTRVINPLKVYAFLVDIHWLAEKEPFGYELEIRSLLSRIQMAAQMLLRSSDSITEISEKCGFSSDSYFGKIFRERMKVTPREYRKNRKNWWKDPLCYKGGAYEIRFCNNDRQKGKRCHCGGKNPGERRRDR